MTASGRCGRFAGVQPDRTLALGRVIVGHADGVGSALDGVADGHAAPDSASAFQLTRLHFRTLSVAFALIFGQRTASVAIVGVSGESVATHALTRVAGGFAVAVGRTGESAADQSAFADSQHIRSAGVLVTAIRIGYAVRKRRFLADSGHRIADEIELTLAVRFAVFDATHLVLSAGGFAAQIHAVFDSVHVRTADGVARALIIAAAPVFRHLLLASGLQVVGVAEESVLTDARRSVVIRHAQGVGSALDAGAGIDAVTRSIRRSGADVQTNLPSRTVQIVATRRHSAAFSSGRRVADETRKADANSVAAGRVRTADDAGTGAVARQRAILTGDGGSGRTSGHAHHERIAGEALLTLTVVASGCVEADGVGSAGVADTFVDV